MNVKNVSRDSLFTVENVLLYLLVAWWLKILHVFNAHKIIFWRILQIVFYYHLTVQWLTMREIVQNVRLDFTWMSLDFVISLLLIAQQQTSMETAPHVTQECSLTKWKIVWYYQKIVYELNKIMYVLNVVMVSL